MRQLFNPISVFRTIAENAEIFGPIQGEMRKQAQALLEKSLKSKPFTLDNLRTVHGELGKDEFALFADAMSAASVRKVVKKFDPHHPQCKVKENQINVEWAREHILNLANGTVEPEPKLVSLDKLLPAAKRTQDNLARIYHELGPERFSASLGEMTGTAQATFVKKLDPKNPKAKGKAADIDAQWARRRIAELASDGSMDLPETEPSIEPEKRNLFDEAHRVYSTKRKAG